MRLVQLPRSVGLILGLLASDFAHGSDFTEAAARPVPALETLAAREKIPIDGFDAARVQQLLRPGDRISALFTLRDGIRTQQWLADIQVAPLSAKEQAAKPAVNTIYTAAGHEYHLAGASAAFTLRVFGPAANDSSDRDIAEKRARFLVKEDYLGFGYDRMGELALRLRPLGKEISLGMATGKFSAEQIAWGQRWVEETGFTPDDELVCVKQAFAQVEFLQLARQTPGFEDILKATLDLPSIWTVLRTRNFGVWFSYDWKRLERRDGAAYGVSAPVYSLPFKLTMFGRHVANGEWLATAAWPPFLASAGILGLMVSPPEKPEKRLEMRVIAARCASKG